MDHFRPFSSTAVSQPVLDACLQASRRLEPAHLSNALAMLVRVANGEIQRTEQQASQISAALEFVLDALFLAPWNKSYTVPANFWMEPGIGEVCASVVQWLYGDEIITYTEAGRLLYKDAAAINQTTLIARVRRLVESGKLKRYPHPQTAMAGQPQGVLRREVLALQPHLAS